MKSAFPATMQVEYPKRFSFEPSQVFVEARSHTKGQAASQLPESTANDTCARCIFKVLYSRVPARMPSHSLGINQ